MEKQLQPKLRFPEFSGDYVVQVLKDIAKFSKGKNISKADIIEDGVIECIRYGELYTTYNEVINKVKSKTNIDQKQLIFSEANDVIIPASGESAIDIATASCVIRDGVALGGDLNIIKTPENGVYLSYYFNNKKKFDIAKKSQGISVIHIYADHLKSLKLILPSLPEQQKIADYLTTIDRKIELLQEKKTELTRYKKAMMQKLFAQEIRFKDENGNDYPEWEEKRLGDVAEIIGGGTPQTNVDDYWSGNIDWYTPTEINKKYIGASKRKITELGLQKSSAKLLPKGTILFTSRATIGECSILVQQGSTNQGFQSFVANKLTNNEFLYYYLIQAKHIFLSLSSGSTFLEISKSKIGKVRLQLPSLLEQQKIANFLSAIDENITKVEEQIKETQNFKKAMLQQMFV